MSWVKRLLAALMVIGLASFAEAKAAAANAGTFDAALRRCANGCTSVLPL